MRPLRAGIVGAGWIAGVHARVYAGLPAVRVVGVADPVEAKAATLAGRYEAVAVPDVEGLLDLGVDLVSVCTPPDRHAEPAVRALEAGVHVLCEKPIARRIADAQRIVDAAGRAGDGVVAMVGHVSRFEPDHATARACVADGRIGTLQMMRHSATTSIPGWSEGGWLTDRARSGGPLLDQGVHSLDYFAWLAGAPAERIHAVAADSAAGPGTYVLATTRYRGGAIGHVEVSWAHPAARGFKLGMEIAGSAGRLTWSYDDLMGGVLHSSDGPAWYDTVGESGFEVELRAFVDAIRAGAVSPVGPAIALEALRAALGGLESIRTGEPVDLTSWVPT